MNLGKVTEIELNNNKIKIQEVHGEIKDHFYLSKGKDQNLLIEVDEIGKQYPLIFFDPGDAEKFRKDFNLDGSIVFHNTGITFYDDGAYTIYKGDE